MYDLLNNVHCNSILREVDRLCGRVHISVPFALQPTGTSIVSISTWGKALARLAAAASTNMVSSCRFVHVVFDLCTLTSVYPDGTVAKDEPRFFTDSDGARKPIRNST